MTIILVAIYGWLFYELKNAPLLDNDYNPVSGLRFDGNHVSLYKKGHRVLKITKEQFKELRNESNN